MPLIVVSNTSPIINLAAIDRLDLLQRLYRKLLIPGAVYEEIAVVGSEQPGAEEVQTQDWIETREVADRALVAALSAELDAGEAEAIALAVEQHAALVLLDERRGRDAAARLRIRFIGLLGALIQAREKGYIPAVKPVVDELIAKAGFWISRELYARISQK